MAAESERHIGVHVGRDWVTGKRPTLSAHLRAAAEAAAAGNVGGATHAPTRLGSAQVFLFQPKKPVPTVDVAEAAEFKATAAELGIRTLSHSSYLAAPWKGSPFADALIRAERRVAAAAGCEGLVVHLGTQDPAVVCDVLPRLIGKRRYRASAAADAPVVELPVDGGDGTPIPLVEVTSRKGVTSWQQAPVSVRRGGAEPCLKTVANAAAAAGGGLDLAPGFHRMAELPAGVARPRVLLEPSGHVKPENSHYHTPPQLGELLRRIREGPDPGLSETGLCIDTAHLWANGVDVRSAEDAEAWVTAFQEEVDTHMVGPRGGFEPSSLALHLNDSEDVLGGAQDKHAGLLKGNLWGRYGAAPATVAAPHAEPVAAPATVADSGLPAFVRLAETRRSVIILERKPNALLGNDLAVLATI
jgi:hypothetical protein